MLNRKFGALMIVLCLFILVMAGCGGNQSSESVSESKDSNESSGEQETTEVTKENSNYPEKEITLIVPWAAGGGTDAIGRQLASQMEKELDQPVVVVNKEGGGGLVGFKEISKADPDGYTIGLISNSLLLQKYVSKSFVDYTSYEPIALVNQDPASLTVNSEAPWETASEFIEAAKKDPGSFRVSNSGPGAIWHVSAMALEKDTNTEFQHTPYDGGNPAAVAVASDNVEATTVSAAEVQSLTEAGEVKILGVAAEERLPQFPEVPTLKEQGIDTVIGVWRGFMAPKGTPSEVIEALDSAIENAVNSSEFEEFMENGGYGIRHIPSNDFGGFLKEEDTNYSELLEGIEQ